MARPESPRFDIPLLDSACSVQFPPTSRRSSGEWPRKLANWKLGQNRSILNHPEVAASFLTPNPNNARSELNTCSGSHRPSVLCNFQVCNCSENMMLELEQGRVVGAEVLVLLHLLKRLLQEFN